MKLSPFLLVSFAALLQFSGALAQAPHDDEADPAASSDSQGPTTSSTDATHATTGAEPGSHADWCGEHEVPESQCTRCDKELIPAFKASNDWCAEHGLPESHCRACNPELVIERPEEGE